MLGNTLEAILAMQPGEFYRSASGFFGRTQAGEIVFLPSVFRLPWHAKQPRVVSAGKIFSILRGERIEIAVAVFLLFAATHYFFFDILDFYLAVFGAPLAAAIHVLTVLAGILLIFRINNIPFAWLRARTVRNLPVNETVFTPEAFERWRMRQRLWKLSLLTGEAAAGLHKNAVLLYAFMFLCSVPLLAVIVTGVLASGAGQDGDPVFLMLFGLYVALSLWAALESSLVLRQRMRAGRARRLAQRSEVEESDTEDGDAEPA